MIVRIARFLSLEGISLEGIGPSFNAAARARFRAVIVVVAFGGAQKNSSRR
ncbi:MAG: hypothetical protein WAM75_14800 [Xanthobacteraceae bacterium]